MSSTIGNWVSVDGQRLFRIPEFTVLPHGDLQIRSQDGGIRSVDATFAQAFEVSDDHKHGNGAANWPYGSVIAQNLEEWEQFLGRLKDADGRQGLEQVLSALGNVLTEGTNPDPKRRAAAPAQLDDLRAMLSALGVDIGGALDDLPKHLAGLREQYKAGKNAEKLAERMETLAGDIGDATPEFARFLTEAAEKLRGTQERKHAPDVKPET